MSEDARAQHERLVKAAAVIRHLKERVAGLESAQSEPVAIVGMGCRFPGGGDGPEAFWALLAEGRDAIAPLAGRWATVGGEPTGSVPRWAGLILGEIEAFDADFFGISPREARSLDPQQRLLLEVAWEAIEDAGIVHRSLAGGRAGVFVGACMTDYARVVSRGAEDEQDAYAVTGNMLSVAAGRLAYTLGLRGPCMTIDTACSSSMVALHLACASLRSRESDLAIAGGVNLILSPDTMAAAARTQALSPDGRCHTFDSNANGFVRGEGCGLLVLKRLTDAQRDGDRVWAIVRGSAVNQDGRSTGLTAPNVLSQESLLRDALRNARVEPEAIDYVETHGTGTALGDPIEVEALQSVLGAPRIDGSRCVLGAVKTNIGHLEGAAGVAGVIKAVLSLHHERIPRNLNFRTLNPRIRLDGSVLTLATEATPWPRSARRRLAGASGFGLSGTNAHLVLEEAPVAARAPPTPERQAELVVLSARSAAALDAQAALLLERLDAHPELRLGDVAFSLATTRGHMERRLSVTASSEEALRESLRAAARGRTPPNAVRTAVASARGRVAFLFAGQGAQVPGMGQGLHAEWSAFRETLDRCLALFDGELDRPLREVMWPDSGGDRAALLDRTMYTQPALFAFEYALSALWRTWGVDPEIVAGHSVGELAAACVAGVFSLEDAVRLVAARGRLMDALPSGGAMVSIAASETEVAVAVGPHAAISIAAVNGPEQVVIAGPEGLVSAIAESFRARGVGIRHLSVSHAFHSPLMEPMVEEFATVARSIAYHRPTLPLVSNVSGRLAADEVSTADYWVRHVRSAVRFADGVKTMHEAGVSTFVEMGPKATLLGLVRACLPGVDPALLPSLRAGRDESRSVLEALGGFWAAGGSVSWPGVFPAGGRRVQLPTYPWQRERHWIDASARAARGEGRMPSPGHPLLGESRTLSTQASTRLWDTTLDSRRLPWINDHRVLGAAILPAAAHLEMALAAGAEAFVGRFRVTDVAFIEALAVPEGASLALQVVATEGPPGQQQFQVASRAPGSGGGSWRVHARGVLRVAPPAYGAARLDLPGLRARLGGPTSAVPIYAALAGMGLGYGPAFQGLVELWSGDGESLGRVRLPGAAGAPEAYRLHPALLDGCFHALAGALPGTNDSTPWVPVEVSSLQLFQRPSGELWCHARSVSDAPERRTYDLSLADGAGEPVAEMSGLVLQRLPGEVRRHPPDDWYLELAWEPSPVAAPRITAGRFLLLGRGEGLGERVSAALEAAGHAVVLSTESEPTVADLRSLLASAFGIDPPTSVVHLGSLDGGDGLDVESVERTLACGCDSALATVQAMVAMGYREAPRLWLVTRAAQAAGGGDVAVAQAPLLGLGRVVAMEHADLRCARLDLDPAQPHGEVEALLAELLADDDEDEVAWRGDVRRVGRLTRRPPDEWPAWSRASSAGSIRSDGTYLVTGGLGGLGLSVSGWLGGQGAGHLVLVGRSGAARAEQRAAVAALEARGVRVTVTRADMSDRDQVGQVLREIAASGPPLRGVVHAAGALDDGLLLHLTPSRLRTVMAPKLWGALHLDALTRDLPLDFFVLYASAAGLLGSPGQGNYAAANTFLDAMAHHRRAQGLPGLSVDWGAYSDVGMAAAQADRGARLLARGMRSLTPDEGLSALERLLKSDRTQVGVVPLDFREWADADPAVASSRILARMVTALGPDAYRSSGSRLLLDRLATVPRDAQIAMVREFLCTQVAQVLRRSEGVLDVHAPLSSLGIDSLMGLELRNRLEAAFGSHLPATLIWQHPTIAAIAELLLDRQLRGSSTSDAGSPASSPPSVVGSEEPAAGRAPIPRAAVADTDPGPLSAGQARLWFFDQLVPDSALYNVHVGLNISGRLDYGALRDSLSAVVARHPMLRATFPVRMDGPRVVVAGPTAWELPRVDLRSLDPEAQVIELDRLAAQRSSAPFDLARGPILRATLVALGDEEHVLLVTQHHIATDAWSIGVFSRDRAEFYRAFLASRRRPLPTLPIRYGDYARWQELELQSEGARRSEAWWKQQLQGLPRLDLPRFKSPDASPSHVGGTIRFAISPAQSTRLKELAGQASCTLFVALLSVWATLLHRYSGQVEFAIGTVTAGRDRSELRDLIGFFVNTLVLRCDLSGDPDVATLMRRLHLVVEGALTHGELPFDRVVSSLGAPRGRDLNPLFRAAFIFENAPFADINLPGLVVTPVLQKSDGGVHGISKFELGLTMVETARGVDATIEYAVHLFDPATIERMVGHFQALLSGFLADPSCRVSEVGLVTEAERRALLEGCNRTAVPYPEDRCIHELFEAQVARTPDAVAVVFEDQHLTYRELDARADLLARHLQGLGVGPEVRVAVRVERSQEMVVGLLGILKAGGAYVPLDTALPRQRLALLLEDSAAEVLLTQQSLLDTLPSHGSRVVLLDTGWESITAGKPVRRTRAAAGDLAYVIYTSGSTGRPKGVEVAHGAVVNFLSAMAERPGCAPSDQLLAVTSLSFDIAGLEVWLPLTVGARVEVASRSTATDGTLLRRKLDQGAFTILQATPSTFRLLVGAGWRGGPGLKVLVGGEAIHSDLADRLIDRAQSVWNMYGPTETTIWSCIHRLEKGAPVRIGRPIANTRTYVLDRCLAPVPVGVAGDLYIGGAGLARGYLNRPELTRERFLQDPFIDEPGARIYNTGDRCRWSPEGTLEYLGRTDDQVKLRGFRIEPGEIESVLARHAAVREAVVTVREDIPGDQRLVAYVVAREPPLPGLRELRGHLEARLPDYMVPSAFVELLALPLTPNGKVDRAALPIPDGATVRTERSHVAPRNSVEEALAVIWTDILGAAGVGVEDNFFEIGGQSILATHVVSRVCAEFGVEVPLRAMFEAPTIAALAAYVDAVRSGSTLLPGRSAQLEDDALLAPEIAPRWVGARADPSRGSLLLTGATGFLGAFLLAELLEQTPGTVLCLVRARDEAEGAQRLRANLEAYGLWKSTLVSRIAAVPGDLGQPLFGLTLERFDQLADEVGRVYHNGALVNFLHPYDALRGPNVIGTREVLRLATRGRRKQVHYVSTVSVIPFDTPAPINEDAPLGPSSALDGGYAQSKWVAERLVREAARRGVPLAIYRPGRITGHSETGAWNTDDLACKFIRGCIELGVAPESAGRFDLTPVDYVSRGLVALSLEERSTGHTFHLVNPEAVPAGALWSQLRSLGYQVDGCTYREWLGVLAAESSASGSETLSELTALVPETNDLPTWNLGTEQTQRALDAVGIRCPPADDRLLSRYVNALVDRGFLPPPPAATPTPIRVD